MEENRVEMENNKMNNNFYKSIIDQDRAAVVICNLEHEIICMNPAAIKNYEKWGGAKLIGNSLMECHNPNSREKIEKVVNWFAADESHNLVYTYHNEKQNNISCRTPPDSLRRLSRRNPRKHIGLRKAAGYP